MRYLRQRNRKVRAALYRLAFPESRGDAERFDAEPVPLTAAEAARVLAAVQALEGAQARIAGVDLQVLAELAAMTDAQATARFARQASRVVTISWEDIGLATDTLDAWVRENVELIKTIDTRYFADVQSVVRSAADTGQTTRSLTRELAQRFAVSQSRAELIARDQLSKLNGQIAAKRQTDYGVSRYRWSTSGDERVRASHEALDGRVFAWNQPPAEGHPGEAVLCRCVAEPIFEDEEDEAASVEAQRARVIRENQILATSPISTGAIVPNRRRLPAARRAEFVARYRPQS
jgi:SPP1 gp7 family putative phage head morphogenesis protein